MTALNSSEYELLGRKLETYCIKYNIRIEDFFQIPRTPSVLLKDDPNWQPLDQIQAALEVIVRAKRLRHN